MNNIPVAPCCRGNDNFLLIFLILMIFAPGMFGGIGNNSMMFFLLIFMLMGEGRVF